ncbi:MAG: hypothetical protein M1570_01540 [Chloroflexi bacterium]|nr:hypothetical protein [Chloroflexota bacterium]
MQRLLARLAVLGILLLAIGFAFGENQVTAQSGATPVFLPFVSNYTPRQLNMLSPTAGRSTGGIGYEDSVPDDVRVSEVWLSVGSVIEGVQIWYLHPDGMLYTSGPHGSWGGKLYSIVFDPDEYIVALRGKSGMFMDSLSIVTNKRTFVGPDGRPYGGSGGDTDFSIDAPPNNEIVGLFGRAGGWLDYTGALARQRWLTPPPTPVPPETARPLIRLLPGAGWGHDGLQYQDTVPDDGRVSEVWVSAGTMVDSIQFWYLRADGTLYSPGQRGFVSKGEMHKAVFAADEYITALHIHAGEFTDAISIVTNKQTFGPWGGDGGDPNDIFAPAGYEICGLYGSYSLGINWTGALARQRR